MAYDRAGTGPWAWLKAVGAAGSPLKRDWRAEDEHLLWYCWFSKHPRSLQEGDLLVYYAAQWMRLPAIMELISDEVLDDHAGHPVHGKRWRYKMEVRPLVVLPMGDAPTLDDVGIDPLRVRRQSHIKLTREEYLVARDLITAAAGRDVDQ